MSCWDEIYKNVFIQNTTKNVFSFNMIRTKGSKMFNLFMYSTVYIICDLRMWQAETINYKVYHNNVYIDFFTA